MPALLSFPTYPPSHFLLFPMPVPLYLVPALHLFSSHTPPLASCLPLPQLLPACISILPFFLICLYYCVFPACPSPSYCVPIDCCHLYHTMPAACLPPYLPLVPHCLPAYPYMCVPLWEGAGDYAWEEDGSVCLLPRETLVEGGGGMDHVHVCLCHLFFSAPACLPAICSAWFWSCLMTLLYFPPLPFPLPFTGTACLPDVETLLPPCPCACLPSTTYPIYSSYYYLHAFPCPFPHLPACLALMHGN